MWWRERKSSILGKTNIGGCRRLGSHRKCKPCIVLNYITLLRESSTRVRNFSLGKTHAFSPSMN